MPPIQRLDMETDKKLLTIEASKPSLKNYRCFLALTDRIREENGDFFLQPHRTSVVWGGQKALFIFQHHSGEFGLYYDLQTRNLISDESGGGVTRVVYNRDEKPHFYSDPDLDPGAVSSRRGREKTVRGEVRYSTC